MNENSFKHVKRANRLSVQVAEQVEEFILSGKFSIGDKLPPERELCEQFGVSRTVVREAVRVLEAKGLLGSHGGSGTYVRALDADDVANSLGMYLTTRNDTASYEKIMEVRKVLEVQNAALAAERVTDEGILELEKSLSKMEDALDDPEKFAQFDLEFHIELARATGNELFVVILDPFMDVMYEAVLAHNLPDPPDWTLRLHRRIFEKVKAGDSSGAAEAMASALDQEKPS